jgi:hypothetical protein
MPILYGEREQNAFKLQVIIFQTVPDHSIFAWEAGQVIIPLVSEIKLISVLQDEDFRAQL